MLEIQAIGYIGQNAKQSETKQGKQISSFTMAISQKVSKDETKTIWLNVTVYDKPQLHQYLSKGTQLLIRGTPNPRMYIAQDGQNKLSFDVTANEIKLLGTPKTP